MAVGVAMNLLTPRNFLVLGVGEVGGNTRPPTSPTGVSDPRFFTQLRRHWFPSGTKILLRRPLEIRTGVRGTPRASPGACGRLFTIILLMAIYPFFGFVAGPL